MGLNPEDRPSLIKQSGQINLASRSGCIRCGGFGAIKKEEEVLTSPGN